MKKIVISFIAVCLIALMGQAQLRTPAPSPSQTIKQDFGISSIEISYSRPSIKGRTFFDNGSELAPLGVLWRTGANAATTISFGDTVIIGGKKVVPGKYGLLTIPGKDEWSVIITKQLNVTSADAYKAENDVVVVKSKPLAIQSHIETFTMQFADVKENTCELHLMWGKTAVALPIATDYDNQVMKQIDNLVKKDNRPYYQAAMYYLNTGKDLNQALAWFDKALEANSKAFWIWHEKANCLLKLGKKDEAKQAAQKSLELAKEANEMPYIIRNQKLLEKL